MIHEPAIKRIKQSVDPEGFYNLFLALCEEAKAEDNEVGQCCIPLIEEDDDYEVGTWVPELWLVVRKVLDD